MTLADTEALPLCATAPRAPWWEIIKQRWSGRADRALVLRDRSGALHLHGADRAAAQVPYAPAPQPAGHHASVATSTAGGYDSAFHVRLGEHFGTRTVALPTAYATEPVDLRVLWWVHDPVQVVRTWTAQGWDEVRKNLDQRVRGMEADRAGQGQGLGADDLARDLAAPLPLADVGLTYRVTGAHGQDAGELRLGHAEGGTPQYWNASHREEYQFCLDAVRNGPASLAALWLLRHPEQVSQVLDWSVGHRDLLRAESTWQDEMAALLGSLTEQERQELSGLVRDRLQALGRRVPQQGNGTPGPAPAHAPAPAPHAYPYGTGDGGTP
ncbi:hypothetical protein [Streptomyces yaizuensis]|uniref:PE-PGRS family protein n=1 Tax=Streptomyces yaizuensis TaxID=2989713 RepID=A0ABQ5NRN6_9ACTN|nr:hypothetical protein [Streptomyces sp. YSPA8]GLF92932.1 hypothetical protein SYYSPA8_01565 [Streptomyces sp. YSPA8]